MKRGLQVFGLLFTGVLLYATALHAAGVVMLYPTERTVCAVSEAAEPEELSFPVSVEGTPLVVEHLVYYEGACLENGTEEPIVGALALVVRNTGKQYVLDAELTLMGDTSDYHFRASYLPPQSQTLLLETGGALWTKKPMYECTATVRLGTEMLLSESILRVEDVDMGTVAVTNTTENTLEDIRLVYKNYLSNADLYLGGISYPQLITELAPGQTVLLNPPRYASGYSRFIWAEEGKTETQE